jgi:hypothetical protein
MHLRRLRLLVLAAAACALALAAAGPAAAERADAQLLRTYQPVTYFHPLEQFRPTSVQSFIADADLEQCVAPNPLACALDSSWVLANPDPEPGSLPGPGTGIWRLNQDSCSSAAPLGGLACYVSAWRRGSGGSAVYGRVARFPTATVLQYWFFYYDNVYTYLLPPAGGFIWQAHEGDWEVVNVVLGADGAPVEAAYSRHCSGERRAWADVPRWNGTHPIVYVAHGSHANYFEPGVHPFDVACIPPEVQAYFAAIPLLLPADYAAAGDVEGPPRSGGRVTTIRNADPHSQSWLAFPGFWGELQYFQGPGVGTVLFGTSPVGPAYQRTWTDPLGTIASWPEG